MPRLAAFVIGALLAAAMPALAASGDMNMPMSMAEPPAVIEPTAQAWTAGHRFLVKLVAVPRPIPYEKYFDLRLAVFDGRDPAKRLTNATLQVDVGMRHGMTHGFAHGMQSAPKIAAKDGVFTVSGMYFHMMGPWTLRATVHRGGRTGTAEFQLPCCGQ
jgi:hypothetical protein